MVEHYLDTVGVGGSNPPVPTKLSFQRILINFIADAFADPHVNYRADLGRAVVVRCIRTKA